MLLCCTQAPVLHLSIELTWVLVHINIIGPHNAGAELTEQPLPKPDVKVHSPEIQDTVQQVAQINIGITPATESPKLVSCGLMLASITRQQLLFAGFNQSFHG
jgi:hypothetical protein